jgi:hypothetical protein
MAQGMNGRRVTERLNERTRMSGMAPSCLVHGVAHSEDLPSEFSRHDGEALNVPIGTLSESELNGAWLCGSPFLHGSYIAQI